MSATTIDVVPRSRQTVELARLRTARGTAGDDNGGYSMSKLAKLMNRSTSWISRVERGHSSITEDEVDLWAEKTGVDADWLYGAGDLLGGS